MSSASGSCTPLPPATGGAGYYEATCNAGTKVEERPRSCFIRMVPDVTTITSYKYYVVPDNAYGTRFARLAAMEIGRANVGTPATMAHHECRLLFEKKNK